MIANAFWRVQVQFEQSDPIQPGVEPVMTSMTPIKVRGKRRGTISEKWNQGKNRRARVGPDTSLSPALGTTSLPLQQTSRKRKRAGTRLSNLEQLPTEIIQAIFEYSANLNLPHVSPTLQAQLCDRHVYEILTSRILRPVLGLRSTLMDQSNSASSDVVAASRLLGCKFMTWPFFRNWIEVHAEKMMSEELPNEDPSSLLFLKTIWSRLEPLPALLPPRKLLHGPWSDDQVSFLDVLALGRTSLLTDSAILGEVAHEGLAEAITESHAYAVVTLLHLGVIPTTEMLRLAVVDAGCDCEIVLQLTKASHKARSIDFLDSTLWSWAERAQSAGDEKGVWLITLLKQNGGGRRVHRSYSKGA